MKKVIADIIFALLINAIGVFIGIILGIEFSRQLPELQAPSYAASMWAVAGIATGIYILEFAVLLPIAILGIWLYFRLKGTLTPE